MKLGFLLIQMSKLEAKVAHLGFLTKLASSSLAPCLREVRGTSWVNTSSMLGIQNSYSPLTSFADGIKQKIQNQEYEDAFGDLCFLANSLEPTSPLELVQKVFDSLIQILPKLSYEHLEKIDDLVEYKLRNFTFKNVQCQLALAFGDFFPIGQYKKKIYLYSQALKMGADLLKTHQKMTGVLLKHATESILSDQGRVL